ncbi:hypothetical protein BN903_85 [Halorubrum sp. AJ67]|nr:hypothetical protein BN903_85 [Halorubrum sp. AJ67]
MWVDSVTDPSTSTHTIDVHGKEQAVDSVYQKINQLFQPHSQVSPLIFTPVST